VSNGRRIGVANVCGSQGKSIAADWRFAVTKLKIHQTNPDRRAVMQRARWQTARRSGEKINKALMGNANRQQRRSISGWNIIVARCVPQFFSPLVSFTNP
jgi:hypothetical protein